MTRRWRRKARGGAASIGAIGLGAALSACVALPDPVPTTPYRAPVPGGWQSTNPIDAPAPAEWWRAFGDPRLTGYVVEAVGENETVWKTQAQAAQARAAAAIAGADRLPSVGGGFSTERARANSMTPLGRVTTNEHSLALSVDWEIDLWGRLAAQTASARETYLSSLEGLRAVRQSIAAQTAKAYFAVVESRQQVALSQQTLEVMTETARQVGNRADVGVGSPGDKYLAIANRDAAAAGLAGNSEALERLTRQLEVLVSDYPSGTVDTASALPSVPPLPPLGLPAELLARRPDILAAERTLRATGFDTAAARRSLLPAISLSGSTGYVSPELDTLLDGNFSFWTLAGNLVQPIFQGGRLLANVELNEAEQQEAASDYAQTVLTAFAEVESALAARGRINERVAALCSGAGSAKSAEEISFNRYRQGVEPFLTVLQAQQTALDASSACISARADALVNHIDLMLALGGGFDDPPPAPEPSMSTLRRTTTILMDDMGLRVPLTEPRADDARPVTQ